MEQQVRKGHGFTVPQYIFDEIRSSSAEYDMSMGAFVRELICDIHATIESRGGFKDKSIGKFGTLHVVLSDEEYQMLRDISDYVGVTPGVAITVMLGERNVG